jgi:hypothetical protein
MARPQAKNQATVPTISQSVPSELQQIPAHSFQGMEEALLTEEQTRSALIFDLSLIQGS